MATSGLSNFGFTTEAIDLITEAFERIGREASSLSANDIDSARRALQYLFMDWQNDQVNLWTVELIYLPLVVGTQSYTLDRTILTILQAATRQTSGGINTDLVIQPISRAEYLALPNKAQVSDRPTSYYLQRTTTPVLFIWPVLQTGSSCTILYEAIRSFYDMGDFTNTMDAPNRWMDAMAAGMAVRLATKWAPERKADLMEDYNLSYARAKMEDRERVPLRIAPDIRGC